MSGFPALDPWAEIRRVAEVHACESLLIGLGALPPGGALESDVEALMNGVDGDVAVIRAAPGWSLDTARRGVVPVGGRGEEHGLRARVLASICRDPTRDITFVTVVPAAASEAEVAELRREVSRMAEVKVRGKPRVEVLRSDDPVKALLAAAADHDRVILGLQRRGWGRRVIGEIAARIARDAPCPAILLGRRPSQLEPEVYRPLRDAVNMAPWAPARTRPVTR
jgi:nucleotide-binding universal stress UspA family protein